MVRRVRMWRRRAWFDLKRCASGNSSSTVPARPFHLLGLALWRWPSLSWNCHSNYLHIALMVNYVIVVMASYSTKRVQVDFPESWIPEIDHEKEIEDRSRHNMILRLVREALDARASARMTLRLKDWHKPAVVYRLFDADGDLECSRFY